MLTVTLTALVLAAGCAGHCTIPSRAFLRFDRSVPFPKLRSSRTSVAVATITVTSIAVRHHKNNANNSVPARAVRVMSGSGVLVQVQQQSSSSSSTSSSSPSSNDRCMRQQVAADRIAGNSDRYSCVTSCAQAQQSERRRRTQVTAISMPNNIQRPDFTNFNNAVNNNMGGMISSLSTTPKLWEGFDQYRILLPPVAVSPVLLMVLRVLGFNSDGSQHSICGICVNTVPR
jgi:hypothetical protein